jgi:hypothetical protein
MPPSPSQPPTSAQGNVATAADYADAMLIARRARTIFGILLLVILVLQIAFFATFRFSSFLDDYVHPDVPSNVVMLDTPATNPTSAPAAVVDPAKGEGFRQFLRYVVSLSGFFGLIFSILLSLTLLLLLNIMLIGRLIGISKVTSAFVWSLAVLTLVFPWQAFMNNQNLTREEFKVPGVLYSWNEISHHASFSSTDGLAVNVLRWTRFMVAPIITAVIVGVVLSKSGRGLRMALGETSSSGGGSPRKKKKFDDDIDEDHDNLSDRNILT